jgi:hypothetical protein
MSVNLSPSGVRTTVGVPGSGMLYRSPTYKWSKLAGGGSGTSAVPQPRQRQELAMERIELKAEAERLSKEFEEKIQKNLHDQSFKK